MILRPCLAFFLLTAASGCPFFLLKEKPLDQCTKKRLEEIPTKEDKDFKTLGPRQFSKNFQGIVEQNLEPYVFLQLRLEDIAEKSGLYNVSQNETDEILKKLNESREVQDLLLKCNEFHTVPECNSSSTKYRAIDGSCNNLKYPLWGSVHSTTDRYVAASYNGVSGFRKSVSGEDLPNARNISINMENKNVPSNQVSAFFSYYGQFLVHDLTLAPAVARNGTIVPCCEKNPDRNCVDIDISPGDPFYHQFEFSCIPITRTAPYPQCNFNKRQQMNKKTSFLDVSAVYGSNEKEAQQMRANDSSGRLQVRQTPFGEILPHAYSNETLFCIINETERCFLSGDERINQHTMLIFVHTLLVRLHNTIHDKLLGLNPHWDSQKLYDETRRIVIALQQNMVYQEYLPWIVGPENMKKYNLSVEDSLYDEETSPLLFNEFGAASFRLHSMLPKTVSTHYPKIRMSLTYSHFCPVYNGQLDAYITGSCETPSEKFDRFIKTDVRDYLHRPPKGSFGVDLAAINIQRGRDHGLASYIDVVEKCSEGKTRIKTFLDLENRMSEDSVTFLKKIYSDVRDVELWLGMTAETPIEGGVTGPTATCISAIQFHRLKFGDSFFYTHKNGRHPFTEDQLETIKSFSVARWLCDTTRYDKVRRYPFAVPGKNNPVTACQKIQPLDLSLWREKP